MSNISNNLKYLRKKKGHTQQGFADIMEIKRSLIGAYEEDRAEPKYELLKKIAEYFDLTIDEFNGKNYIFYHNAKLPGGGEYRRSVAVEEFAYNADGTIPAIEQTVDGPAANPGSACK